MVFYPPVLLGGMIKSYITLWRQIRFYLSTVRPKTLQHQSL
jgi:hypothetical protein